MVEAMTTNETFFFRDKTPFDIFKDTILPQMLAARAGKRKLRIWCAAASSGQEPYSLAMILDEARAKALRLADRDRRDGYCGRSAGERRRRESTPSSRCSADCRSRLLLKLLPAKGRCLAHLGRPIKSMVSFKQMNLIKDFSQLGQFDVIYCRNVLIYFDQPTKTDVLRRLSAALVPDGVMLLGGGRDRHWSHRRALAAPAATRPLCGVEERGGECSAACGGRGLNQPPSVSTKRTGAAGAGRGEFALPHHHLAAPPWCRPASL